MQDQLRYAILGRGRWGTTVHLALQTMGRRVLVSSLGRPLEDEYPSQYAERLQQEMHYLTTEADILWAAIPPRDQAVVLAEALRTGLHVIAEKPWMADDEVTAELTRIALEKKCVVGVNFQYCLLDEVRRTSEAIKTANESPLIFTGKFRISRENRLNIPALHNLGSHLMAIRNHHFPTARVEMLDVGYESEDERWLCIASSSAERRCDLLRHSQNIVSDFILLFEKAILRGVPFPFDLDFTRTVATNLREFKNAESNGQASTMHTCS